MTRSILGRFGKRHVVAAVVLAALGSVGAVCRAQDTFTVSISEKEMKLDNPTDMMWDKWLMWDIGFQRMVERNQPYIELRNDHPTDAIKEFHLSIGDTRFNFAPVEGSSLALLGSSTPSPPGASITSSTKNNAGDELIVNIGGGGLAPGELFRMKVNLDVDASYAAQYAALFSDSLPDFRTVLFDMNGRNVYDGNALQISSADNAKAWVVYDPATGPDITTNPVAFEDPLVAVAAFFNSNVRTDYHDMDPVLIFDLEGPQVPEPSSVCLVIVALCAGLFGLRTRRSAVKV